METKFEIQINAEHKELAKLVTEFVTSRNYKLEDVAVSFGLMLASFDYVTGKRGIETPFKYFVDMAYSQIKEKHPLFINH